MPLSALKRQSLDPMDSAGFFGRIRMIAHRPIGIRKRPGNGGFCFVLSGVVAVAVAATMGLRAAEPEQLPDPEVTSDYRLEDRHFSAFGSNAYFSLNPGYRLSLKGLEADTEWSLDVTVLNETKVITLPTAAGPRKITARVIEERDLLDGQLVQVARYWYARSIDTGDIFYFGEEVEIFENDVGTGRTRTWEAGIEEAKPGLAVPATFMVGARYYQNFAPGAAVDYAENLAAGLTLTTGVATFRNCVQVRELNRFRSDTPPAIKTYAPGIGLVRDDHVSLVEVRVGTTGAPIGATFVPFGSHPLLPLSPGRQCVLARTNNGTAMVLETRVNEVVREVPYTMDGQFKRIQTAIYEERWRADGRLTEVTRRLLAQCQETGDVYQFGFEVDRFEGGGVIRHEGSWLAGVDSAEPGLFLPGTSTQGVVYRRANAPGMGLEEVSILAADSRLETPAGTFEHCLRVEIQRLGEPVGILGQQAYAPGLGLVESFGGLKLVSLSDPQVAAGTRRPILAVQSAVLGLGPEFEPESLFGLSWAGWAMEKTSSITTVPRVEGLQTFREPTPKNSLRLPPSDSEPKP